MQEKVFGFSTVLSLRAQNFKIVYISGPSVGPFFKTKKYDKLASMLTFMLRYDIILALNMTSIGANMIDYKYEKMFGSCHPPTV